MDGAVVCSNPAQPPAAGRCLWGWCQLSGRRLHCSGTWLQSTMCSWDGDVTTDPTTTCCASLLCENYPLLLAETACMHFYSTEGGIAWPWWHGPSVLWCPAAHHAVPCSSQRQAHHNSIMTMERLSCSCHFSGVISHMQKKESRRTGFAIPVVTDNNWE